jgi:hypothetical protein
MAGGKPEKNIGVMKAGFYSRTEEVWRERGERERRSGEREGEERRGEERRGE